MLMSFCHYLDTTPGSPSPYLGLIPINLHIDGAEFYSNSEFYVWSVGSAFASGEASWMEQYELRFCQDKITFQMSSG